MGFQEKFEAFKESKWVVPTYIILVILATIGIGYVGGCLSLILIPVAMFAIPYYLGEKRIKYFLLLAVIIIIVDSLVIGAVGAYLVTGRNATMQKSPDKTTITNGIVHPFYGDVDTLFNFTVTFTSDNITNTEDANVTVYLNISNREVFKRDDQEFFPMGQIDINDLDATDGKDYYFTRTFPEGIYFSHFSAEIKTPPGGGGPIWYDTLVYDELSDAYLTTFGPVNSDVFYIFQIYFVSMIVSMIFTTLLFMIFVMMYWWMGRARIERTKWEERMREAGELEPSETKIPEFECTNCGRPVHEDAVRCPHCGAVFDEDEEEE